MPVSRRINVSFTPGQPTNIVQTVKGYPTALSFFDTTGEPWPIAWDTNSNPAGVAGGANCSSDQRAGGPAVAAVGFYVCTPVKGSNVVEIAPASLTPRGGLLVTLAGAPKPISFLLVAGGGKFDADLSVHVAERGPKAKVQIVTRSRAPETGTAFLTAMLDGVPPAEATPLMVSGVSPEDLRAWKLGDRVFLRTRLTLLSPEWTASENGAGGLTVYSVPATPVVLLSERGRTVSASLRNLGRGGCVSKCSCRIWRGHGARLGSGPARLLIIAGIGVSMAGSPSGRGRLPCARSRNPGREDASEVESSAGRHAEQSGSGRAACAKRLGRRRRSLGEGRSYTPPMPASVPLKIVDTPAAVETAKEEPPPQPGVRPVPEPAPTYVPPEEIARRTGAL